MCRPQSGAGECSWPFTVVLYSCLSFTRRTVETNNADSLINKFTIQAAALRSVNGCAWKRVSTQFLVPRLLQQPKSFLLQVKSKQESDLKVKTFAPPYVCRIHVLYLHLTVFPPKVGDFLVALHENTFPHILSEILPFCIIKNSISGFQNKKTPRHYCAVYPVTAGGLQIYIIGMFILKISSHLYYVTISFKLCLEYDQHRKVFPFILSWVPLIPCMYCLMWRLI